MGRTVFVLSIALLCGVAMGSDSPKEYDGRTEVAGIEGTWRLTEAAVGGRSGFTIVTQVIFFRSGLVKINGRGDTERGNYRIDRTPNPLHLDWMPSNGDFKGQTLKFIYQIDGDTLRMARMDSDLSLHPQGFNGEDVLVETYKRVR
jgi:uncharacterized protein (TIGR03067 family)